LGVPNENEPSRMRRLIFCLMPPIAGGTMSEHHQNKCSDPINQLCPLLTSANEPIEPMQSYYGVATSAMPTEF